MEQLASTNPCELFGEAEVYLASHHWPIWGNAAHHGFPGSAARYLYKYLHDQTVRLFNAGMTPAEIAEALELPESLRPFLPQPRLLRHHPA